MLACIVGAVAAIVLAAGIWTLWQRTRGARVPARRMRMRVRAPSRRSRIRLELDADGASRSSGASATARAELVRFDEPFGVVLLVPRPERSTRTTRSDVGQLVFTGPERTRTVFIELDEHLRQHPARLRRLDAGAPTGGQVLSANDARRLLEAIERRAPAAFERLYLSTSAGPLVVEDSTIHLPDVSFDLRRPLVHDSYVFLEGPVLYRALAVRQAARVGETQERAFVVPLAEPVGADHDRSRAAHVPHRAAPRREQRVALEQIFFAPLAVLLAEAPRTEDLLGLAASDPASSAPPAAVETEADRGGALANAAASNPRRGAES